MQEDLKKNTRNGCNDTGAWIYVWFCTRSKIIKVREENYEVLWVKFMKNQLKILLS